VDVFLDPIDVSENRPLTAAWLHFNNCNNYTSLHEFDVPVLLGRDQLSKITAVFIEVLNKIKCPLSVTYLLNDP